MKCVVCSKEVEKEKNSIVCSNKCSVIRLKVMEIQRKHFPTNGCDNCRGDLHQGCTDQCRKEFKESHAFGTELWSIVDLFKSSNRVGMLRDI